jgi:hypothetical protein
MPQEKYCNRSCVIKGCNKEIEDGHFTCLEHSSCCSPTEKTNESKVGSQGVFPPNLREQIHSTLEQFVEEVNGKASDYDYMMVEDKIMERITTEFEKIADDALRSHKDCSATCADDIEDQLRTAINYYKK